MRRSIPEVGLGLVLACSMLVAACGHPATREECEIIFEKSAELQLKDQNLTDQAVVDERIGAFKAARGDALIEKCLGRTMTRSALECVKKATTAEAVDRCLM